jgi:hypothetical protein
MGVMSAPPPPYDRAIALPCRMSIFRDRWLAAHCRCGHIANNPIRLMMQEDSGAGARTLAETVISTRCKGCSERPAWVYLTADGCGVDVTGGSQGWVILLHAVEAS